MGCKCQICGKQYKVDIIVPNELWEKIKPKGKNVGCGLLCGSCIMSKIEAFSNYSAYKITPITNLLSGKK